ncbi:hypothetical protein BD560DRAFT_429353 [Blakeslea trispora]|nr:hypothetical protein BD560DRAFT_429353 [Blakeslea trispora]
MQQQAAVTGFLGRAVEEKFHLKAFFLRIMPCIPLISDNLKKMVHPEIGPFNLSAGVREGYFSVNLSLNQNFQLGTEFYPNERAKELFDDFELDILEQERRQANTTRNNNEEMEDVAPNETERSARKNQYCTDDDEPYSPPNNDHLYNRRFSDVSAASNPSLQKAIDDLERIIDDPEMHEMDAYVQSVIQEMNEQETKKAGGLDDCMGEGDQQTETSTRSQSKGNQLTKSEKMSLAFYLQQRLDYLKLQEWPIMVLITQGRKGLQNLQRQNHQLHSTQRYESSSFQNSLPSSRKGKEKAVYRTTIEDVDDSEDMREQFRLTEEFSIAEQHNNRMRSVPLTPTKAGVFIANSFFCFHQDIRPKAYEYSAFEDSMVQEDSTQIRKRGRPRKPF